MAADNNSNVQLRFIDNLQGLFITSAIMDPYKISKCAYFLLRRYTTALPEEKPINQQEINDHEQMNLSKDDQCSNQGQVQLQEVDEAIDLLDGECSSQVNQSQENQIVQQSEQQDQENQQKIVYKKQSTKFDKILPGAKGTLFISIPKTSTPLKQVYEQLKQAKEQQVNFEYISKFYPVYSTCKAEKEDIQKYTQLVLKKFEFDQAYLSIFVKVRNQTGVNENNILTWLKEVNIQQIARNNFKQELQINHLYSAPQTSFKTEQLLIDLNSLKDQIKKVTEGPLYNPKMQIIRVTFEAPDNSKIDISIMQLYVSYNPTNQKFKFLFQVKDNQSTQEFIKQLGQHFEEMKTPIAARIIWLSNNFDAFLLKCYQWFERYQSVDDSGSTCMRYLLKNQPSHISTQVAQQSVKKKVEVKQAIQQKQEASNTQPTTNTETDSQQKFQISVKKPDPLQQKYKLVDVNEFKTIDQWEYENEDIKRENEAKSTSQPAEVEVEQPKHNIKQYVLNRENQVSWTEEHSTIYQQLVIQTQKNTLFNELLQLGRMFSQNSFQFISITKDIVVCSFYYQFNKLLDTQIQSEYLKQLQEYILNPEAKIQFIIQFNINKPQQSFIRLDPQGDIILEMNRYIKQFIQRPESTHKDVTDRTFLSFCSRFMTQLMRYNMQVVLSQKQPEVQSQQQNIVFNTEIIRPKQINQNSSTLKNAQQYIDPEKSDLLIQQLPEPLNQIPTTLQKMPFSIMDFINTKVPLLFTSIFKKSVEQVFEDRVQQYMIDAGYARKDGDSSSDSEYYDESEGDYEEYDEPSDSSSSSIYNSHGFIKENFLFNQEFNNNSIMLRLADFDLTGGLLIQIVRPIISVVCTKCLKMMPLQLNPDMVKNEYGTFQESNILSGNSECQSCQVMLKLQLASQVFNHFTQGQCLYVVKQQNCLPVNIGYFSETTVYIQCSGCESLGVQNGLRELVGQNVFQCRCPMCFRRIRLSFQNSYFLLPNGEQLPLPSGVKIQHQKTAQQKTGPLPLKGTCEHAKRSFRWFRFACGGAYPCDTCHEKQCQCGDKYAKAMICGFCGRGGAVQDICSFCKSCLIAKKTGHWEGGRGNRNQNTLSRKDNRKYIGKFKTRSNKDIKRTAQQKRGNKKKKDDGM